MFLVTMIIKNTGTKELSYLIKLITKVKMLQIDPFTGRPSIYKKKTTQIVNQYGGGGSSSSSTYSLDIGNTIGNSPTSNGLLYADSGGLLKNNLINIQEDSFFAGAVTAKSLESTTYPNFPTFGWVDATGLGASPAVGVLTAGVTATNYLMVDTSSLTARGVINYNPGTPASSYFTIALANGLGGGHWYRRLCPSKYAE